MRKPTAHTKECKQIGKMWAMDMISDRHSLIPPDQVAKKLFNNLDWFNREYYTGGWFIGVWRRHALYRSFRRTLIKANLPPATITSTVMAMENYDATYDWGQRYYASLLSR